MVYVLYFVQTILFRLLKGVIYIKKKLPIDEEFIQERRKTVDKIVEDLNRLLDGKVKFSVDENDILNILVYEENLKSKAGRPAGYEFDYQQVKQMQDAGMTNKQIYTELGMSKSLFYLRMKEYKK